MAKKTTLNQNITHFIAPKHWPTWLGMGIAYLLSYLPWTIQKALGTGLGKLHYALSHRRKEICHTNLHICFPDLSEDDREKLARAHFESMAIGVFEMFTAWFRNPEKTATKVTFNDQEVVNRAVAKGKGCIMVGAHFSSIDLCGTQIARFIDVHPIYKLQRNPVMNWVMERQRQAVFSKTIERKNTKEIFRSLKDNKTVWFAVDQDYGRKNSVFAPFYGRECATISHISRLAKSTGATILLYDYGRTKDGYLLSLQEVKGYPTGDDITDATLLNKLIEQHIEPKREQYFWSHRRFKTQKDPQDPSPYKIKKR